METFNNPQVSNLEKIGVWSAEKLAGKVKELDERARQFDLDVLGAENFENLKDKSFVLVANHVQPHGGALESSGIGPDSFLLRRVVREQTGKELRASAVVDPEFIKLIPGSEKVLRGAVKQLGHIPTSKFKKFNRDFIEGVEKAVASNDPILIYPQGNWHDEFSLDDPIKPGAAKVAIKHNIPILPAYMTGCPSWKLDKKVTVAIGKPINPNDFGKDKESVSDINREIGQRISSLQQQVKSPMFMEK